MGASASVSACACVCESASIHVCASMRECMYVCGVWCGCARVRVCACVRFGARAIVQPIQVSASASVSVVRQLGKQIAVWQFEQAVVGRRTQSSAKPQNKTKQNKTKNYCTVL